MSNANNTDATATTTTYTIVGGKMVKTKTTTKQATLIKVWTSAAYPDTTVECWSAGPGLYLVFLAVDRVPFPPGAYDFATKGEALRAFASLQECQERAA